jgi:dephospho-CoA kinase
MVIGLTGQIGAGKSTAARILARLGATVIDADRIGHAVVTQSAALRQQLAGAFGKDIFDRVGKLRRRQLAARAFVSKKSRDRLNNLIHPYLLRELRRQVRLAQKKGPVVIDAALLLHWRMDREVDLVLVIHAGWALRLKRAIKRGFSEADVRARQRAQLPFREFQRRADRVILNNRSETDLRRKLTHFWNRRVAESD